jgi:hypothetical protein
MAIAFDSSSAIGAASGTSRTVSHTIGGGSNMLLWGFGFGSSGDLLTGITYNSVSMTFGYKLNITGNQWIYAYYLASPASGAHNLTANYSATEGEAQVQGLAFSGVAQSSIIDNEAQRTGSSAGTTITETLTTVADNCLAVLVARNGGGPFAAGTGSTANPSVSQHTMLMPLRLPQAVIRCHGLGVRGQLSMVTL